MKRVAILQFNYIPWKSYFDIIHDVDLFMFYDNLQYTKNDWRNRNKIKTPQGLRWLTIPVGGSKGRLICEIELDDPRWQNKHWLTIQQNYAKTPYFAKYRSFFEEVYLGRQWSNLSELNQFLIKEISRDILSLNTQFCDSREYTVEGQRLDRLIKLAHKAGATSFVSGPAAKDYILEDHFQEAGIELVWKSYAGYPEAPQGCPPFEHGVSILDLLFHTGPDASWYIWGWRKDRGACSP